MAAEILPENKRAKVCEFNMIISNQLIFSTFLSRGNKYFPVSGPVNHYFICWNIRVREREVIFRHQVLSRIWSYFYNLRCHQSLGKFIHLFMRSGFVNFSTSAF